MSIYRLFFGACYCEHIILDMSILWLKNFAGVKSDADFRKVSNGKVELGIHVTAKSIQVHVLFLQICIMELQAMTVFGSVVAPIMTILLRKGCPKTALYRGGKVGMFTGKFTRHSSHHL